MDAKNAVELKKLNKGCRDAVKKLHWEAFQKEDVKYPGFDEYLNGFLQNKGNQFSYGLYVEGALTGILWGYLLTNTLGLPGAQMEVFAIDPRRKGMGYGKKMMELFQRKMEEQGVVNLQLSVKPGSVAEHLYEQAGFEADDLRAMNCFLMNTKNPQFQKLVSQF